jgi:hypothetical protein
MLQKARTKEEAKQIGDALIGWMYSSGFKPLKRITPTVIREVDEEVTGPEFQEQSSVPINQQGSPTTQISQGLNSGVNNRLAANVGTPPPAASIDRNRFASLFPNDPISGLINAQQQGTTQFMQYGGMAGDPSYDMGLETDVTAQQAIQSALSEGVDLGGSDNNIQVSPKVITKVPPKVQLPSTLKQNQETRPTGILSINNPLLQQAYDFVTGKKGYQPFLKQLPGGGMQFLITKTFQDGGFVDAGGGGDEDDYVSDAFSQSDFNQFSGQDNIDFSNYADETKAMQDAQGIVNLAGQKRSNIRDSVNYDPVYAQALNITRGLLPGNQGQGIQNLTRPPSLTPQVPGRFDSEADMVRPMFYSGAEKFLVQDAPGLVRQAMDMGIMGLVRKAGDYFSGNFSKLFGDNIISPQQRKRTDIQ